MRFCQPPPPVTFSLASRSPPPPPASPRLAAVASCYLIAYGQQEDRDPHAALVLSLLALVAVIVVLLAVFLGVVSLLVASLATREPAIIARGALVAAFLSLTTPVAAHAVARAAFRRHEQVRTPGAPDESGSDLTSAGPEPDQDEALEGRLA